MSIMYRHGDVLLIRRDDEIAAEGEQTEIVVAEGEVTGHAHRLRGERLALLDLSDHSGSVSDIIGRLRLHVPRGGQITHEEHRTLVLEAGVYEVRHQRTMSQPGLWERVRD